MSQRVFHILRGGVGGAGKRAEGRHIHKDPLPEAADIQLPDLPADNGLGGFGWIGGNLQAGGKVIGAALRQIPYHRRMRQRLKAGDDLVQRAVAAYGHHRVIRAAGLLRNAAGIPGRSSAADAEEIPGVAERGRRIVERAAGLAAPGAGIDDHQKLLLGFHIQASEEK